ncbi:MAG TPA: hypothetical protein VFB79_23920 [Candidatus Angelobacter sp.]|nr:hypothetical protein [Candidatus Angelobacter sp.]
MKALYVLLALSMAAVIWAVGAMVWRLRWHLKNPHVTPPTPKFETQSIEIRPEHGPVEKA